MSISNGELRGWIATEELISLFCDVLPVYNMRAKTSDLYDEKYILNRRKTASSKTHVTTWVP